MSHRLATRGLLTVIALRMVPVAPYPVINLMAGASHIRLRDFALGTLLGLFPGSVAIALFTETVERSIRADTSGGLTGWVVGLIVVVAVALWIRSKLVPRLLSEDPADGSFVADHQSSDGRENESDR